VGRLVYTNLLLRCGFLLEKKILESVQLLQRSPYKYISHFHLFIYQYISINIKIRINTSVCACVFSPFFWCSSPSRPWIARTRVWRVPPREWCRYRIWRQPGSAPVCMYIQNKQRQWSVAVLNLFMYAKVRLFHSSTNPLILFCNVMSTPPPPAKY